MTVRVLSDVAVFTSTPAWPNRLVLRVSTAKVGDSTFANGAHIQDASERDYVVVPPEAYRDLGRIFLALADDLEL